MVWYSHLFKSFSQCVMLHTVKGFSIVDETEVDILLELSSFLCDPVNVGILFSASSSFSKPRLNIWKFLVHVMVKPSMQDFKHDLTSMGCYCCSVAQSWLTATPWAAAYQTSLSFTISHYVSNSGRPSRGHRTGKGQSSSQSPERVVPNNVLMIRQLHSSPMLVRSCLKSCMLGFSIM